MKVKKLLGAVLASLGITAAAPASAIIVGGIDFGVLGQTAHIETATLAENFVNTPGQTLTGYGLITTVNGDTSYCADGTSNCGLYYIYNYTVATFTPTYVTFSGGVVDVYYQGGPQINLLNQDSPTNLATIAAMTPWVSLDGHNFLDLATLTVQSLNGTGTLTGATATGTGAGQLDVDTSGAFGLASVAAYLDANSIPDNLGGFADIVLTSSFNNFVLNPFDVANGLANSCQTVNQVAGEWCFQGTANLRGATVLPEPGTLALLGLALLGFGVARIRRS